MMMWPLPDDGSSSEGRRRPPATEDPDIRLTHRVAAALLSDGRARYHRITVRVQNRVVLLGGTVDTDSGRLTAHDIARNIDGVADICDSMQVTADAAGSRAPRGDQFQQIVADLQADAPPVGQPFRPGGPKLILWSVLAAVAWAVLTVLMVAGRWDGVAVVGAAAAVSLTAVQLRRMRLVRRPG